MVRSLKIRRPVHFLVGLGLLLCFSGNGTPSLGVESPARVLRPLLDDNATEALSQALRDFLIANFPDPLLEEQKDWGRTIRVPNGIKWKGKGLHVRPEITHTDKNQGTWRTLRVMAVNLPQNLVTDIRDVRKVDQGGVQLGVYVSFAARVEATQQKWEAGIKLYDGSLRARFRVKLVLLCEVTSRLEANAPLLPDVILRLRVRKADLQYDHFVTEHVAGFGGEAARLLGEAIRKSLRPSLERKFLSQADAAIVKAGDTKEVRLSLASLLK
jgi:hypothetical protein